MLFKTKIQKNFLDKILFKNPEKRLTISEIRKHAYMKNFIKKIQVIYKKYIYRKIFKIKRLLGKLSK